MVAVSAGTYERRCLPSCLPACAAAGLPGQGPGSRGRTLKTNPVVDVRSLVSQSLLFARHRRFGGVVTVPSDALTVTIATVPVTTALTKSRTAGGATSSAAPLCGTTMAAQCCRLRSETVELTRFDTAHEGAPVLGIAMEHATVRLRRVAQNDHVTSLGNLDAFVGCAEASSAPGSPNCLPDLVW